MLILRLLGGLTLETGAPIGRAAQKRRLALLSVLATRPGVPVTRDKLLALFWPESSSDEARHRLSAALYDLRRALGDDIFVTRGDEVSIPVGSIRCDVVDFEAAVAASDWQQATHLYRGPFLDGVHIEDASEFETWVEQRRTQLARSFSKSLEEWARDCTARCEHGAAVEAWQRLADADPLNDSLALGLMKAFEAAGNRAGALRYAMEHEQRLREDMGVEPNAAVRSYALALRNTPFIPNAPARDAQVPRGNDDSSATAGSRDTHASAPGEPVATISPKPVHRFRRGFAAALALFVLLPAALSILPMQPEARSASVTANATTALAAMHDGEASLRSGRFETAVAAFERAVNLDSSLAAAYFQLAVATLWADQPGEKVDARIANAFARRDRLDELNRMMLEGFIAWRRGEWHQAEAVYRRALTSYQASVSARHELGEVMFHYNAPQGRPLDEARVEFERVLEREPDHYGALWHLAQIAARDRRVDDVRLLTDHLRALEPDAIRSLEVEVLRASALGDAAGLDRLIGRLRDADESLLFGVGWRLAISARDLAAAERVFTLMTDASRGSNAQAIGHTQLLYVDLARGRDSAVVSRLGTVAALRNGGAGIELLTVLAAMSTGNSLPASLIHAARDSLAVTIAGEAFQSASALYKIRMLATLGAIHAVLGDSARASAVTGRLEKLSTDSVERRQAESHSFTIRALLARNDGRHEDVIRWTDRSLAYRWFGVAIFDPLSAYSIDRFIRAEALLALGRKGEADAWFATIGDHDPSDLAFLGSALDQRTRIANARGDRAAAARLIEERNRLR